MKAFLLIALLVTSFSVTCPAQEGRGLVATTDLFLFRPVSLVGTIAGSALWVASLPFTLPSKSQGKALDVMVKTPYQWTFERPLAEP